MKKRILITGSNGLLGQKLVSCFRDKYDVLATSIGPCRIQSQVGFQYQSLDVTNESEVNNLVVRFSPDFIVNAAALTDVDRCEVDIQLCNDLNVNAVNYLAHACKKIDAYLVHISTDFIFDGASGPYSEGDPPNPLNHYGLSKLRSEELLAKNICDYSVLRTIILYGIADNMNRNNIVLWARESLKSGKSLNIIDDQFRSPTLAEDLAHACMLVVERRAQGIFHVSGKEIMSIFEMIEEMARFYGVSLSNVNRISSKELNQTAKRPLKTGFILTKSINQLGYEPHSFQEGLSMIEEQILDI